MNQTVHETADSAKDKAREAGEQAQEKAKGQVDSRTSQAGDQLQDKADSLHQVGDDLRERGDDTFAQVADRVAGLTEDVARYLRGADADQILGDVERYARKQPWAVAAGGALLGFAASRVIRAGTERRSQSGSGDHGRYSAGTDREIDLTRGYAAGGTGTAGTAYGTGTTGTGYQSFEDPVPGTVPETGRAPLGDGTYPSTTGSGYGGTDVNR